MQSNDELKEIFKAVTNMLTKPITNGNFESKLIENGLLTDLKPIEIKKFMADLGYKKKQKMVDGKRDRYWFSDVFDESDISKKIRFNNFLKKYLDGLNVDYVKFRDLEKVMRENNFEKSTWDKHFFRDDGTFKIMNGWILSGPPPTSNSNIRIYKKLDCTKKDCLDDDITEPENDF